MNFRMKDGTRSSQQILLMMSQQLPMDRLLVSGLFQAAREASEPLQACLDWNLQSKLVHSQFHGKTTLTYSLPFAFHKRRKELLQVLHVEKSCRLLPAEELKALLCDALMPSPGPVCFGSG